MFEEMLLRWHGLENAACAAEAHFRRLGQGAASPEAAALALKARQARAEADAVLKDLLALVPKTGPTP